MEGERMVDLRTGSWVAALMVIALAAVTACASEGPDATVPTVVSQEARASASPTPTSTRTLTPTVTAFPGPTEPPSSGATPTVVGTPAEGYESNSAMHALLSGLGPESIYDSSALDTALAAIREHRDLSQVPVLIDLMRFLTGAASEAIAASLEELTGQEFGRDWNQWMEWLGKNASDYATPEDYPEWKSRLYSMVHPRFADFLRDAGETARIDLTEVVWGGVVPDGIPDLRNPAKLTVAEAEYMNPDDRVFGVSINGEHRAYPLRIINAHEMANDVLGGEPISVLW